MECGNEVQILEWAVVGDKDFPQVYRDCCIISHPDSLNSGTENNQTVPETMIIWVDGTKNTPIEDARIFYKFVRSIGYTPFPFKDICNKIRDMRH